MSDTFDTRALALLRRLTGDASSVFRDDQLDVIRSLVEGRKRMLLVKRTGWGKSAVYFIATKMLRDQGAGPTLLVSPLLALMRNQREAAQRMGVQAETIHSDNQDDWYAIVSQLMADAVDLLLISPERLANPQFRSDVLPVVTRRSGLLVIDEAHCISDWGHDFRPDYRRLVRVLDLLPAGIPVLCCTATANDRVVNDIVSQLGTNLAPVRGSLARDGLHLAVLHLPRQEERLVWLAKQIPRLRGTGIVYCLRVADTNRVAGWLRANGINAVAYSGDTDPDERVKIERALLSNERKVVVSTSALGMGFDKPDLAFVIHYQSPGSSISYYQQVGRAGRALTESWGVLLSGNEDADIQGYFIHSAFPPPDLATEVVDLLENCVEPMKTNEILEYVNIRKGQLERLSKILEVENAIERKGSQWLRTLNAWTYDYDRAQSVTALRRAEQLQMSRYIRATDCRMQLMRGFLDDRSKELCGICDNCSDLGLEVSASPFELRRAEKFLRAAVLSIEPRKQFPDKRNIPPNRRLEVGRTLAIWRDGGWGSLVQSGTQQGDFDDQLVVAAEHLIRERWCLDPAPTWVTYVPSLRNLNLVRNFAERLAVLLGLTCDDVVVKVRDTEPQKSMQNSPKQYANVLGVFEVRTPVPDGPVLLVDDVVDSRWTWTAIGWKLRAAGVPHVYPFALAAAGRSVK